MKKLKFFYFAIFVIITFASCLSARKASYLADIDAERSSVDSVAQELAKRVYPGDILQIKIVTKDPESNQLLNSGGINTGSNSGQGGGGYLIDINGDIDIPGFGRVNVRGMTPFEIREMLLNKLSEDYKDIFVYCTISGRVMIFQSRAGTSSGNVSGGRGIPIENETLTILEAINGTSPININPEKVWLIREENNKREIIKLNLNSVEIFNSPYFYLRNNDMIFMQPRKLQRFNDANAPVRNLWGIVTGLSGFVIALIALLK